MSAHESATASRRASWLLLLVACGEPIADPAPEPERLEVPAPEQVGLFGDLESLGHALSEYGPMAERLVATEAGVVALRRVAEMARVRSVRSGKVSDLHRAREWLVAAGARGRLAGACEATAELCGLHARDRSDFPEAYRCAFGGTHRFTDGRCLARLRWMLAILAPFAPPREELALLAADPHRDDPSMGTPVAAGGPGRDALSRWSAEHGAASTLTALRSHPGERSVRTVLRMSRVASFETRELPPEGELPGRMVVTFADTRVGPDLPTTYSVMRAGLRRVRLRTVAGGALHVTFDLDPDVHPRLFVMTDPYRLVVDVNAPSSEEPAPVSGSGRPLRVVVLDPGHGGVDRGAQHGGLVEAELTLLLAKEAAALLRRRAHNTRVVLTRDDDSFVSLEERVALANSEGADIFVSIHLNAADDPVRHGGVTTFVLDTSDDVQALRLAARENGTSTDEVTGLQGILASLHRSEQLTASRVLAALVQRGTWAGGRRVLADLPDRGVKSAMFYVLVGATMPAVLLEASFLTQPHERRALRTSAYRSALAEGIVEGIVRYGRGASPPR